MPVPEGNTNVPQHALIAPAYDNRLDKPVRPLPS